ncbi:MAG: hypothetical protein AAFY76_00920 [Cyanobacteria bacterium J06649_11]
MEEIRRLIEHDKLGDALNALEKLTVEDDFYNEISLLRSRIQSHNKKIRANIIKPQDANIEKNKLRLSILELASLIFRPSSSSAASKNDLPVLTEGNAQTYRDKYLILTQERLILVTEVSCIEKDIELLENRLRIFPSKDGLDSVVTSSIQVFQEEKKRLVIRQENILNKIIEIDDQLSFK